MTGTTPSGAGAAVSSEDAIATAGGRRDDDYRVIVSHYAGAIRAEAILNGDRVPSERQMMDDFGASRNTVRRALAALERDGFVERRRGSGTYVTHGKPGAGVAGLQSSKIAPIDVLEARLILEPGFVDLIVSRATPEDFNRMEKCLDRADRATSQDEFRDAALAFRMAAVEATRNTLLIQMYQFIMDSRKDAGWHRLRNVDESKEAQRKRTARNRAFLEALRDRNKPLARQLIRSRLALMVGEVLGAPVNDADLPGPTHSTDH